jgi:hypothetical protein
MLTRSRPVGLSLAAFGAFLSLPLLASRTAAQSLETFVLTAGGESNGVGSGCTTFAPPPPAFPHFGNANLFIPTAGFSPCGVQGSYRWTPATVGPARDAMALTVSWPNWSNPTLTTDTKVAAQYRVLTAAAHSDFSGNATPATVAGSSGFAAFHDAFTITSPAIPVGQPGFVRVWVRVTGDLSCTGPGRGAADVELYYRWNQTVSFLFRMAVRDPSSYPDLSSLTGKGLTGFARSAGVGSGSGEVDTWTAYFIAGTPINFGLMLGTFTSPVITSKTSVDFRAWVSRLEVLDGTNLQPVPFTVTSASGASYSSSPSDPAPYLGFPISPLAPAMAELFPLLQP